MKWYGSGGSLYLGLGGPAAEQSQERAVLEEEEGKGERGNLEAAGVRFWGPFWDLWRARMGAETDAVLHSTNTRSTPNPRGTDTKVLWEIK